MARAEDLLIGWGAVGKRSYRIELEPPLLTRRHLLTTGRTGSGKTYWTLGYLLELLLRHSREVQVVLVDGKGEAAEELLDTWLPVLGQRSPHLGPEAVVTVAPWGHYGVPMNVLAPLPGVGADLQAALNVRLFERFLGEAMGARMGPVLQQLLRAVSHTRGSLVQVLRALEDPRYAGAVARCQPDAQLRRYLLEVLPQEPASTLSALRARLRHLLALDRLRFLLGAQGCLSGQDLIGAPLTIITLGNPPQGHAELSRWLGSWWMHVLTAALFDRSNRERDILVVIDEFDMVVPAAADLERILQKARSYKVALHLCTQSLEQVDDARLVQTVLTNASMWMAMSPRDAELSHLSRVLPPCRGERPDPDQPDRLLTPAQEEAARLRRLRALGPRQGLFADLAQARSLLIHQTPALPVAEVRQRAKALPQALRDAYWRGRFGALPQALPQAPDVSDPAAGEGTEAPPVALRTQGKPRPPARARRPTLELP